MGEWMLRNEETMVIEKIREPLVRWKYRIGYLSGFITTFAAILIIANTLQDKLVLLHLNIPFLILFPVTFIIILFGAYILDKLGFIDSEIEYSNTKNRVLKEIHQNR